VANADERLSTLQPDSVAEFAELREAAAAAVDASRLELCRLLLAERLGGSDHAQLAELDPTKASAIEEWETSPLFDTADRAFLGFTEQFSVSVDHISQDQTDALLEHASEQEVFDFAIALYVLEMEMRMSSVAQAMLASPAVRR
jgi:hypothetical protein